MDLFKSIKELKTYTENLAELCDSLVIHESKVKIGKFKIIQTPSEIAAKRLHEKLHCAVYDELTEIKNACTQIESAFEQLQTDLFKTEVHEPKENTLTFGSKVQ